MKKKEQSGREGRKEEGRKENREPPHERVRCEEEKGTEIREEGGMTIISFI
jgi:hypothetical protein